jgi:2-polyprenyl-3-methyl-5-hydroxy-6-metoxy-1,4-benzoquinol methylase
LKIETEKADCPLCGQFTIAKNLTVSTKDYSFETSDDDYCYVFCIRCRIYFLENRPIASEMKKIYPNNYSGWRQRSKFMYVMRRKNFESKYLNTLPALKSKVLDFGCGNGEFLASLRNSGAELVGFDFSLGQIPKDLLEKGAIAFTTSIEDLQRHAPFDRIFLLQVIEHLPNPVELMNHLRTFLSDYGQIVIETPSRTGWDSKIAPAKYWGGWHAPRHFHIWDQESLRNLSTKANLKITHITYLPSPYQWAETLKPRAPKFIKSTISSENVIFVSIFYLLDKLQILIRKKSSNMNVVFTKI